MAVGKGVGEVGVLCEKGERAACLSFEADRAIGNSGHSKGVLAELCIEGEGGWGGGARYHHAP
jgi:hypothetical protein